MERVVDGGDGGLPHFSPRPYSLDPGPFDRLTGWCEGGGADPERGLAAVLERRALSGRCASRLSARELACALGCARDEPELELAFRHLRLSLNTLEHLPGLCERGAVSALLWVVEGRPRYLVCGGRERVQGSAVFQSTLRLLSLLSCSSQVPDVLLALDNLDYAVPQLSPNVPGWLQPLPGVARYTGSPAHPTLLLPNNAYVAASTHCEIQGAGARAWARVCRKQDESKSRPAPMPWSARQRVMFWRGSSTGLPLDPVVLDYLPRPALVRTLFAEPGFDVGFVGGPPPTRSKAYAAFFLEHRKDAVPSGSFADRRFLLHVDGHTASWGLAHKLTTGSLVVWSPSAFGYREWYYSLLKPWVHYVPAEVHELRAARDWLFSRDGDAAAQRIAAAGAALFRSRLRPEDTYCYLSRLLNSLADVQSRPATRDVVRSLGIDPASWRDVPDFEELARGER